MAILYNDAKACFDRIIENICNLILISEGLNVKVANLHAATLQQAKYYLKTKFGLSAKANQHNQPEPFLGSGQGAADSMARWSFISDKLIQTYNRLCHTHNHISSISRKELLNRIRAFVDNTNCQMTCNNNSRDTLLTMLQHNTQLWESLLYHMGGKLEISKCKFSIMTWTFDHQGTATIHKPEQNHTFAIIDSETKAQQLITEILPQEPYNLLGIPMALDGNSKAQTQQLLEKSQKCIKTWRKCNLNHWEAQLGLQSIIYPTMKYGLAATTIKFQDLANIQAPLINAILPTLGYNRHMPRALVYGPIAFGGMGIHHLGTEQGVAHVKHTLGSLRNNTNDITAIQSLLEAYSITAGTIGNPLEYTEHIHYIEAP
jgi:hypothetical protein